MILTRIWKKFWISAAFTLCFILSMGSDTGILLSSEFLIRCQSRFRLCFQGQPALFPSFSSRTDWCIIHLMKFRCISETSCRNFNFGYFRINAWNKAHQKQNAHQRTDESFAKEAHHFKIMITISEVKDWIRYSESKTLEKKFLLTEKLLKEIPIDESMITGRTNPCREKMGDK